MTGDINQLKEELMKAQSGNQSMSRGPTGKHSIESASV